MVLYSSGTTSAPKGVELSHLSLNIHAEKVRLCRYAGPTQRLLTGLPYFHAAGSVVRLRFFNYMHTRLIKIARIALRESMKTGYLSRSINPWLSNYLLEYFQR